MFELTQVNSFASSAAVEVDGVIPIALNNLNGYTSITSLFDAYRIVGARSQFTPTSNTYGATATAPIFTVIDYDDNNITAISLLEQYDTLKIAPATSYFERSYKPRPALALSGAGVFTSFGQAPMVWVDSGSPGVAYYGLKYGIPLNAGAVSWTVLTTLFIEAKSQR